jgi:hypothetical protein
MKEPLTLDCFMDAQAMHNSHPDRFEAPTLEELAGIKTGDTVKVCTAGERFWTTVISVNGETITASVDNDLVNTRIHGLKFGDSITFEKRHIYAIYED